ncbi:RagB/SusD family nutrient uptake outer membrane protein [Flavobacterium sp. LS1P28]|uniref:RagB/SusD family nutrient uptake outer membrane protein n=1 Tax=Flavobacterium sp. LS1P28 TaxID=2497752 RepID=UPI000F846BD6|nr:RagB/SusD family nutrient uptake outer membrane protein [Flavobacterium sp. LS1P28]RTY84190.1 RagB/SusD family nutrient uptake outer membrane protein [Flavobacterium sp. LS1P28]
MKKINIIKGIFFVSTLALGVSCTNLEEEVLDGYVVPEKAEGGAINPVQFLSTAYEGLRNFQGQGTMFALNEMSTDALVGPTRGGDWDDAGVWRQIHVHTWGPDHNEVRGAWNQLLSQVNNCNLVIFSGSGTASQKAQARFLRAFYYYHVIDLFGQVPYREAGSSSLADPKVWTRSEATTFVISEVEAVLADLPARIVGDPGTANKDAANFLLAKLYLNKGVFTAADAAGPYTFAAADMTKVVQHVNAINSSLATDYWDNFKPTNNTSPEILFASRNSPGNGGNIQCFWRMGMHYNQTPDGWNGFATVAEYYDKFKSTDRRAKNDDASIIAAFGNPVGFQIGQIYKPGGTQIVRDRIKTDANPLGQPLKYTRELTLITSGATLESAGIRAQKYIPDVASLGSPENDFVLMRYSDALLMKAEAILRGGSGTAPNMTAYFARTNSAAVTLDLEGIYAERGRELWFEEYRRNDMIRFGKFLQERELKKYVSDKRYALYPIPSAALFNVNLKQNPGY